MAALAGQSAAVAIGAAVGSVTGVGAIAGAAVGSSIGGFIGETIGGRIQGGLDQAALDLNRAQAREQAAERSAIHATNFRQALASQVSLASMRGGSGSLIAQFGQQAFRSFEQDQRAIELGLGVSEAKGEISQAGLSADQVRRDLTATTRLGTSLNAINQNLLENKK